MSTPADPLETAEVTQRLTAARDEVDARIAVLGRDFTGIVEASADVATDDEHDPEGATIAFERAQVSALLDAARVQRASLEDALRRVADGTYGRCERCGQRIADDRLSARPAARLCITCAQAS